MNKIANVGRLIHVGLALWVISYTLPPATVHRAIRPPAAVLRALYPDYGTCGACGVPWNCCEPHITTYYATPGSAGCFPLCEPCWRDRTPAQRLPYYEELIERWARMRRHNPDPDEELYEIVQEKDKASLIISAVICGR